MWASGKKKNKRHERDRILDVKMRTHRARSGRLRAIFSALFVFGVALGSLYGVWQGGQWVIREFVLKNESLALRKIEIETDGRISREQIREWSGVRMGDNLLAVPLNRVRRDLEMVPIIREAAIERVLPDTLRIRVTERKALAQVTVYQPGPEGVPFEAWTFHLDAEGFVMLPLPGEVQGNGALASVTGVTGTELKLGERTGSPQILAALRFLEAFQRSSMKAVVQLRSIDVSTPQLLRVRTGGGSEVTFSMAQFDRHLIRWWQAHEYAEHAGRKIKTLDLSVANHVPVVWQEPEPGPGAGEQPVRPAEKNKLKGRKNV